MGHGANFAGSNIDFHAPPGEEETINSLRAFIIPGKLVVTCWQLTPEEIREVNQHGKVFMSMLAKGQLVPHFIGSETSVRGIVADYGKVW